MLDSAGIATVKQEDHYYPFGMVLGGQSYSYSPTEKKNDYLYNGKEFQNELGLDWYDYGARFYDAVIGRWHSIDPMTDKHGDYTPYAYCYNNPIRLIDPVGLDTINPIASTPAYITYENTQEGKDFVSLFTTGNLKNDMLQFSSTSNFYEGKLGEANINLAAYNSDGELITICNIKDANEAAFSLNPILQVTITVEKNSLYNPLQATETIGHETFLHVIDEIKIAKDIMNSTGSNAEKSSALQKLGNSSYVKYSGYTDVQGHADHARLFNGIATHYWNFVSQVYKQYSNRIGFQTWDRIVKKQTQRYNNDPWIQHYLQQNK